MVILNIAIGYIHPPSDFGGLPLPPGKAVSPPPLFFIFFFHHNDRKGCKRDYLDALSHFL